MKPTADMNGWELKKDITKKEKQTDPELGEVHQHLDDLKKINMKNLDFIPRIEMKGITDIFNNYATKKTITAGFFNIALVI